jgi:hypothetical protein
MKNAEIASFENLWHGGYFDVDPLNPNIRSSYRESGTVSVYHATYLYCIKNFITPATIALEIGPGRGAWTKCMLPAKEIHVLDALSAEHNKFFEYVGKASHVFYHQVEDFSCKELPDNYFNYMFSFGCLCHISFKNIQEYAQNLYKKMLPNANCFWMIADYDQHEKATGCKVNGHNLNHDNPLPGRWFNAGKKRTCEMLKAIGYKIIKEDIETCPRDPVIHFLRQYSEVL